MPSWFAIAYPAAIGCYGAYLIGRALLTGVSPAGGIVDFEKDVEPVKFWATIGVGTIVSATCFWLAVEAYRHPF